LQISVISVAVQSRRNGNAEDADMADIADKKGNVYKKKNLR